LLSPGLGAGAFLRPPWNPTAVASTSRRKQGAGSETKIGVATCCGKHMLIPARWNSPKENSMTSQIENGPDSMDHKTCRYICDAVGERLQQNLRPEPTLSSRLQQLLDEMRRRENDRH
jgi:hypothetical protein